MVNYYQLLDLDPDEIDPDRDKAAIRARIEEMRGEWSSGWTADPQQAAVNRGRLDSELLPALEGTEVWREHRQLERERLKKEGVRAESRLTQFAAVLGKRGHGTDDDVKQIVSDLTSKFPRKALEKLLGGPCNKEHVRQWLKRRGLSFTAAATPPLVKPLDAAKAESIFADLNVLVQAGVIKTADLYALLATETRQPVGRSHSARDLKATADDLERKHRGKTDPISTTKLILFGQCRDVLGDDNNKARYDLTLALRPMKQFDTTLRLAAGKTKLILPEVQSEIIGQAAALGVFTDLAMRYIADFATEAGFTLVPVPVHELPPTDGSTPTPAPPNPKSTRPPRTAPTPREEESHPRRQRREHQPTALGMSVWGWLALSAAGSVFLCCGGWLGLVMFVNHRLPTTEPSAPVAFQQLRRGEVRSTTRAPKNHPDPKWKTDPEPAPKGGSGSGREEKSPSKPAEKEVPVERVEPPAPVPVEPSVAVAPAPHRAPLNRPPAGFTSAWVRRGEVRTRVIGAKVIRPVLTNDSGDEFLSQDHYLIIWVETQSLTAANVPLRRWQNPLNEFATLTDAKGTVIKSAKFSGGARVGGQLEGGHNLVPGGPAIVDVLAFEDPGTTARNLRLELAASHVREGGEFVHEIPASTWSK